MFLTILNMPIVSTVVGGLFVGLVLLRLQKKSAK